MSPPEATIAGWLGDVADEAFAYLITTGRVTGNPHEIEIWFAARDRSVYFLSGSGRSDWVANLRRDPRVLVRIAGRTMEGVARIVERDSDEAARARQLVWRKYGMGDDLISWRDTALPVAVDLHAARRS